MSQATDAQDEDSQDLLAEIQTFYSTFAENRLAVVGLILLTVLLIVTILADVIAPYDPNAQNLDSILVGPSLDHPLGTDELGRDVFSRILIGYQNVFTITVGGVMTAFVIGTSIGLVAGY